MAVYYNEIDKYAAAWLRELIKHGHIADGDVDNRSIKDVDPSDIAGFTQCHFFAGIGVWSYALRQASWPDNRPVWTGSCPCQPFSTAGKRKGFADERHLWPEFHRLISSCRPVTVFGEQVASKDGLAWLDALQTDMEREGYTVGAVDTCAAGFGAPHIRQRLYWVADADSSAGLQGRGPGRSDKKWEVVNGHTGRDSSTSGLADDASEQVYEKQQKSTADEGERQADGIGRCDMDCRMEYPDNDGESSSAQSCDVYGVEQCQRRQEEQNKLWTAAAGGTVPFTVGGESSICACPTNGFWRDVDWLFCRDGKWRPVEPGSSPLAHGASARVGRLRGYGNAINAKQAQAFIEAYMEL